MLLVCIQDPRTTWTHTHVRQPNGALCSLPGGILQCPGEESIVICGVLQGVIPCGSSQDTGVRVLATQRVLQSLVKGCFAIGPALSFFKLLKKKDMKYLCQCPSNFVVECSEKEKEMDKVPGC
jgi:hypothetical protein